MARSGIILIESVTC